MKGRPAALLAALVLFAAVILTAADLVPEPAVPEGITEEASFCEAEGRLISAEENAEGSVRAVLEDVTLRRPAAYGTPGSAAREIGSVSKLLVYTGRADMPLGSTVLCRGETSLIREADNPGQYSEKLNWMARGVRCRMEAESFVRTGGKTDLFRESARRVKAYLAEGLSLVLEEKDETMLRAMLLGSGSGLSRCAREELEAGGAAHILTVSGLHVSLVGGGAYLLAGRLLALIPWHRTRGWLYRHGFALCRGLLAGAAVLFYMEMSGAGLSVRRAGTMFLLLLLARALGRSRDFPTALLLAAAAALWPSPYALETSSFQLSFGTVCLLGTVIPFLFGKWRLRTKSGKSVTGAVLLAMGLLPLTLEHFYVWHPWQTAVNLLVLPLLPFVLGTGFLAALAAHLFLPAGRLFAAAAAGLLELIRGICRLSARLPFHALTLGKPALWQHIIWIGLCGILLFLITGKAARRAESPEEALWAAGKRGRFGAVREMIRYALAPGLLLIAGMLLFSLKTEKELTITSLYVGQGDSHVIRTPGGSVYMIDGGRSLSGPGETVLVPFLRYSGFGHLKAVLVTHPDADHINGLAEVLSADGIRADVLGIPAVFRGDPELDELIAAAEEAGTSVLWLAQGDAWQDGDVSFTVLHPPEGEDVSEDPNGASLVLLVRRGEFEGLLTGDIGEDTEARLLAEGLLEETDWLKVPHHGSRYSDSEAFLSALRPLAATISCGRNNLYGHPHEFTLARLAKAGAEVFRTDEDGAVTVRAFADGRMEIRTFHPRQPEKKGGEE